jgi:hypothetical protein
LTRARLIHTPGKGAWLNIAECDLSYCAWLAQRGGKLADPSALVKIPAMTKTPRIVFGGGQTRWMPAKKMPWSLMPRLYIPETPKEGGEP